MLELINAPDFWVAVLQIILINIVLSGDNAVVIALACRNLPAQQRRIGVLWGVAGAVILRIVLTLFAVSLLTLPWLKLCGGILLLWIGVQLLIPENENGPNIRSTDHLFGTIRTIIVADLVMSLDNVLGVAAAAKDNVYLLGLGLAISIPLIVWSSQLIMKIMERFPMVIMAGAGLLGWVAGEMMIGDLVIVAWIGAHLPAAHYVAPALGALLVIATGKWMEGRQAT